jgi:hypothetical protein
MSVSEISAQFAHFFTAAYLVSQCGRWGHKGLIVGAVGMLLWATVKEGWYDEKYESPADRGSSLLDWSFYMAGMILGLLTSI